MWRAMWDVYNKSWEDQIIGKGIKVYEQHCSAKLRACMVGDPFAMYVPDPNDAEIKQMIEDNANDELKAVLGREQGHGTCGRPTRSATKSAARNWRPVMRPTRKPGSSCCETRSAGIRTR